MASNEQYVEGLWALGLPEQFLAGIDTSGRQKDFVDRLQSEHGLTLDQIQNARKIADGRFDDLEGAMDTLTAMGLPIKQIGDTAKEISRTTPGIRPKRGAFGFTLGDLFQAVEQVVGPQMGTQLRIKTGNQPATGEWNPFRGDVPGESPTQAVAPRAGRPSTEDLLTGPEPIPSVDLGPPREEEIPDIGQPDRDGAGTGAGTGLSSGLQRQIDTLTQQLTDQQDVTPEDVHSIIESAYGFSAFALQIPEISQILEQAAREDWDDARIKGAVTSTKWFKRTTDAQRGWLSLEAQDSATAKRRVITQTAELRDIVAQMGFSLDDATLKEVATLSLKFGWSAGQTRDALASEFRYDPTGERSTVTRGLERMAKDFLVPLSDQSMESWGMQILSGDVTEEDFKNYLSDYAKGLYPALADPLEKGQSVRQYMDPYVQLAARNLEISPDQIDLTDPKWMRFVNQADPETGERTVMSLADADTTMKLDPQYGWDQTKQAKQQADQISTKILQDFGAI